MASTVYKLTIPSSTHHLEEVRRFVEEHAHQARLGNDAVEQLKIAVDEACTNVIKHAYQGDATNHIEIGILISSKRFTVRIRDTGRTFDPTRYCVPNIFEAARQHRAGGFGVHIIRSLMDTVEYRKRGKCNEVCLTKYRERATTAD